ncbi:MAG: hemolysin III family protein [Peptoniphilaceae bacterium]|nr:hemolysin III family protein [Peptoniphilaceae bacterium]MDD7382902.1 hemolysin III family protein [Peptoniphilaceae bacterium]MDY3737653.1 hemolysin III family protein [Peptoniphilaceae bacterium]
MNNIKNLPTYSIGEEIFNAITHGIGSILAIAFTVILIVKFFGLNFMVDASIIYGNCLFIMFLASTLYHSITNKKAKSVLRFFDHAAIFLAIGGTYTPILMATFKGRIRIILMIAIWFMCFLGIILKIIQFNISTKKIIPIITYVMYIVIGWISIFMVKEIVSKLGISVFIWILSGGILYSLGFVFYAIKKPYFHSIWHIFILLAALCQFIGILII